MLTTTVCAALTAAGLAVAFLTAYRRRFAAATRIAAFALVPLGLAMAGLVDLAGDVGRAVGGWAADLVLDPAVWAGFGVLAVAVVLYVIARVAAGRGSEAGGGRSRPSRRERRAAAEAGTTHEVPQKSAGVLGSGAADASGGRRKKQAETGAGASGGDEDFSDIEAILKKHGI